MKLRLFYFLTVMILWSCDSERVFEKYQGMETQYWHINDTVSFYFESPLEASASLIAVKYNQDYEFRNLYLRYFLMDSMGNEVESQLVNIPLFESTSGKPLGEGFGSTFTRFDTLPLELGENYHSIHFVQYMRVDQLKGIEAVGLKRTK
ncbi:gliding motility lipoprotein GldH [Mongoliibacter ruber]|uniref:Gliding motility-associated lipoprotein GldH n=1 Tax=Mongoliibacter ruber TaxID=1750599 RepID=A0A2T0WL67_9BACT|nr:gliding motility lipoprotein GldH [Mongoliibacter ruber]PRY87450.1 gliding motility-associated lipoprotein GldH [Mongoliibacter ruber]